MVLNYKGPPPSGWGQLWRAILAPDFPVGLAETLLCLHCSPISPSVQAPFVYCLAEVSSEGIPKNTSTPHSAISESVPVNPDLREGRKIVLRPWLLRKFSLLRFSLIIKKEGKKWPLLKFTRSFAELDTLPFVVSLYLLTFTLVLIYLKIWIDKPTWTHFATEICCGTENYMRNLKDKAFVETGNAEHYSRLEYFW